MLTRLKDSVFKGFTKISVYVIIHMCKQNRKCVYMIQPIHANLSEVRFRGKKRNKQIISNSQIALINAGGIAATAGGLATLITRSYTNSFAQAGVLGVFSAFLAMFFMTPHLIDKISSTSTLSLNVPVKITDAPYITFFKIVNK